MQHSCHDPSTARPGAQKTCARKSRVAPVGMTGKEAAACGGRGAVQFGRGWSAEAFSVAMVTTRSPLRWAAVGICGRAGMAWVGLEMSLWRITKVPGARLFLTVQ